MLAKYESHMDSYRDKLCPFYVHYECRAFNAVCNWHSNIEIIQVLAGSGKVQCGTAVLEIRAGDTVVFNTNVLHRFHKSDDIVYHCIIVDGRFCKENGIFTEQLLFEKQFRSSKTERLCVMAAESYMQYKADGTGLSGAKTRNAVLALLIDLYENHLAQQGRCETGNRNTPETHVKKAATYLMEHCTEPVSLEQLASLCGVSKCHLAREFKRYTGQSILTYVNLIRCKYAEQCMLSGMTVTETAMECGFESVSYFSRTYKKLMGVTPSKVK